MASITDVAHLDTVLIVDGTCYVHEAGGEIVACAAGAGATGCMPARRRRTTRLLDPRTPARGFVLSVTSTVGPSAGSGTALAHLGRGGPTSEP